MNTGKERVISIPVHDLNQLKIILTIWNSYLLSRIEKSPEEERKKLREYFKTPVIYNPEKDQLELLIVVTEDIMEDLSRYITELKEVLQKQRN